MQLEIEREALKKERDKASKARLEKLEAEYLGFAFLLKKIDSRFFTGVVLTPTDYRLSRFADNLVSPPP